MSLYVIVEWAGSGHKLAADEVFDELDDANALRERLETALAGIGGRQRFTVHPLGGELAPPPGPDAGYDEPTGAAFRAAREIDGRAIMLTGECWEAAVRAAAPALGARALHEAADEIERDWADGYGGIVARKLRELAVREAVRHA